MAIDYRRLLNWKIPDIRHTYTLRDTIFYALSVGYGANPEDEAQLRYVYEKELVVAPTMATTIAAPAGWLRDPATGINSVGILAGEQDFEIHRPLPVAGTLIGKSRVAEVVDLGKDRGAAIYTEREVYDESTNERVFAARATTISRTDGGFGGPGRVNRPKTVMPERAPDLVCDIATADNAALVFRLHNPLDPKHADQHADLALARKLGHRRPSLHGLYTLGVAGHALLRSVCNYDATRLKSMGVRFSAAAYPGDTLRTEIWRDGGTVLFQCRSMQRDKIVLSNGRARIED